MDKPDAIEAEGIIQRALANLLNTINSKEQTGVNAKMVIGWTLANALSLLYYDQIGPPLDMCFDLTRQSGADLRQLEEVRRLLAAETPLTVGATITRDGAVLLALAQQGKIVSSMTFQSRQDVDNLIHNIQDPFNSIEELVADSMDAMIYRSVVELRAAIVNHLVSTARPLPSMLTYQFAASLPSLVIAQRLYGDASRYDEIRIENKVVHPAFCPVVGQALSQ